MYGTIWKLVKLVWLIVFLVVVVRMVVLNQDSIKEAAISIQHTLIEVKDKIVKSID